MFCVGGMEADEREVASQPPQLCQGPRGEPLAGGLQALGWGERGKTWIKDLGQNFGYMGCRGPLGEGGRG